LDNKGYKFLRFHSKQGILFVTIDNPPINLLTREMELDWSQMVNTLAQVD